MPPRNFSTGTLPRYATASSGVPQRYNRSTSMSLTLGTRLGPYEILSLIGAGGMGEVYRARDARLDRIVAIKLTQEKFSERFDHEARAVAALNHPNICTVHDVGPNYLVMELVVGQTLREL